MSEQEETSRPMPKGGRKGGAVYPRVDLEKCISWAKKLVSKTHNSPQPRDLIYSGVVGAKSGRGDIRISCLKQYGFLAGNAQGYLASDFAKKTAAAPPEELGPLHAEAALRPTIFRGLFETFQSDTVSKAKLKQRAADLNVHPDETESCVDVYVQTLAFAGLVVVDGEKISHRAQGGAQVAENVPHAESELLVDDGVNLVSQSEGAEDDVDEPNVELLAGGPRRGPTSRSVVHITVTLDASLDAEKLEKQLKMLRKYGAL